MITVVLGLLVMWIYAFGFADKQAAAKLDDPAWSIRAEAICLERNETLRGMASEVRQTSDGSTVELGNAVASATTVIEAALDATVAELPTGDIDRRLIAEYERLYRVYIADRKVAQNLLQAGTMTELNETLENGSPVSKILADFVSVNLMDACRVPNY